MCAYDCVQLQYTIQHRTVLIMFRLSSRQSSQFGYLCQDTCQTHCNVDVFVPQLKQPMIRFHCFRKFTDIDGNLKATTQTCYRRLLLIDRFTELTHAQCTANIAKKLSTSKLSVLKCLLISHAAEIAIHYVHVGSSFIVFRG